MGTVRQLATPIEEGLQAALPTLRKTVVRKLALAVGALLEAQTPNTVELANVLPLETERQDMREQWLRRLLKNPLLSSTEVLEPWARQAPGGGRCAGTDADFEHGSDGSGGSVCDLDDQPRGG